MLGKKIASRVYAHHTLFDQLPAHVREVITKAINISGLRKDEHFNVARVDLEREEVALLSYPSFFAAPFPALAASWKVHLPTASVQFRDYRISLNPPILHRKELMIPGSHPQQESFRQLTTLAESIGLFDDPIRIGFRQQWLELISSKGYQIVGEDLLPAGNAPVAPDGDSVATPSLDHNVQRHLTALSRNFLSAPVQALLRHGVLREGRIFFDYGCGRGDDLAAIESLGFVASGWDPHFRPEGKRKPADVVNLGFVINVIEDIEERIEALQQAFALARGALSVAAMLWSSTSIKGKPFRDGSLTSKATFQRYFSQGELQNFIESVLDEQAFPVGPGVFFVFNDPYLEQQFLVGRHSDCTRAPRLLATREAPLIVPKVRVRARALEEDPVKRAVAEEVREVALDLGRLPEEDEYENAERAIKTLGSWSRVLRAATQITDAALLYRASRLRSDEIRVFFAMQAFGRRKRLKDLEPRLRRDVKAFFGSLEVAEAEGRRLLHDCAQVDAIGKACENAAVNGLGWLHPDHSLQLHTSLIPRLDPILRVYVGCATALYGDVSSADLVKIHIQSGKVTLMRFENFQSSPMPRMIERVKVKLREQDLDVFEYGNDFPPPLLYFKSRYVNEEFANYPEQLAFDRQLEQLGLVDPVGYGPSASDLSAKLAQIRRQVNGMCLVPASDIPPLDSPCGRVFTFRQLIECGETWSRTRPENIPTSADSYNALFELATQVLDPVVDYFGGIRLTYGFASAALTKSIGSGIAPRIDQHAACEVSRRGKRICARGGAAVDFLIDDEDMRHVARWITANCRFDRIYFYGSARPLHVSISERPCEEVYEVITKRGRRIPKRLSL